MIDIPRAVREFLLQRADVRALTDERIWASRVVPPPGYKPEDGAGVAFQVRGGEPTYEDDHYFASVQFKCYGATEIAANTLYRALYDSVHGGVSRCVRHAELEGLGTTMAEPDTEWVYVLVYVTFMFREGE